MSLKDVASTHTPTENSEFGPKKKLVGDAVCEVELDSITGKKDGKKWYMLKCTASNVQADQKGREVTLEPGDEIPFFYDPEDDESVKGLINDLFTAGIEYDKAAESDEALFDAMKAACEGAKVYVRTWTKDKSEEDKEKYGADPSYFQNKKILSKSKVTEENSQPQLPF